MCSRVCDAVADVLRTYRWRCAPEGVGGYADTLVDGGARARAPRPDSVPRPRGAGAGAAEGRALSEGAGRGSRG